MTTNRTVVYDKAKYHLDTVQESGLDEEQSAVHTAFFLGWLMDNGLCSEEFVEDSRDDIAAYRRREKTALEVYGLWDYCLIDDMLSDEGNAFAQSYFDFSTGKYIDDYVELLARKLPSEFHVPYTWKNQRRISHRISKRYSEWKAAANISSPAPASSKRRRDQRNKAPVSTRSSKETPATADRPPKQPAQQRPIGQSRRQSRRQAPAQQRRAARQPVSGKLRWLLMYLVFPVLAVAVCLAIIAYAMTL